MGVEAAKALRARQRELERRVARLVASRDEHGAASGARRDRIQAAVRDGRRALRAREAARGLVRRAEIRAGAALARLTAEGLSLDHALDALGLTASVGRRLIQAARDTTRPLGSIPSTDRAVGSVSGAPADHGETGSAVIGGASTKGLF